MFIDEVTIEVIAGRGGDGCMAFRREKYVSMGGPFGGKGGHGGNIIFKADEGLKTLIDLRFKKLIKGNIGENGEGKNKDGKNAEDTVIKVPLGTTVKDFDSNLVIADLTKHNEEVIVAYGGRGGKGNYALATKSNTCPSFCERGEPGEERKLKVELRMLADVGLVGMPSVGKSTILSMITNANPKIASYHFTTLSPNLGVVIGEKNSFVMADLPGLIEGASLGTGLGHKFLKHIERTKIIAHIIDMSGIEGRDPYDDYVVIRNELKEFSEKLINKPEVIIANKMDLESSKENLKLFKEKVKGKEIYEISALNNEGLDKVIEALGDLVLNTEDEILYSENIQEKHVLYKFKKEKPFSISKDGSVFVISGKEVERIFKMINFNTEESFIRFSKKLRHMGIDEELEKMNVQEGDIIRILDYEFEYTK